MDFSVVEEGDTTLDHQITPEKIGKQEENYENTGLHFEKLPA